MSMSQSAINKDPVSRSGVGYSDFPQTQHLSTSMTVGEMLPGFIDILQPGDKIKLSYNTVARLNYLERPAFEKVEICQDYFFVPMQQLYKPFEQIFYGISDFGTDFLQDTSIYNTKFPFVDIKTIVQALAQADKRTIYNYYSKEYDDIVYPQESSDVTQLKKVLATFRLLDACQFPMRKYAEAFEAVNSDILDDFNLTKTHSLWFLLAYQKIWYDHFRDTDRFENDPGAYNMDSWFYGKRSEGETLSKSIGVRDFIRIAQPHLCPWQNDYFIHNKVSPMINNASGLDPVRSDISMLDRVDLGKVNSWLGVGNFSTLVQAGDFSRDDIAFDPAEDKAISVVPGPSPHPQNLPTAYFSTANMRAAFAVEKLLEVSRRSGKHYDKQTLAHFGVDVPTGTAGECYWISHKSQPVAIGDIVATATTGSSEDSSFLGELGGRGYSNTEAFNIDTLGEFEAKTHGVLMSIIYIRPKATYQQTGINRLTKLINREDFVIPELENLGMQPLFGFESNYYVTRDQSADQEQNDKIRGWKYRYAEFKERYDIARGSILGNYADWSAATVFQGDTIRPQAYYVHPDYLNAILSVQYYGGEYGQNVANYDIDFDASGAQIYAQVYSQDPFVLDIEYNYLKISKMSKFGLPQL